MGKPYIYWLTHQKAIPFIKMHGHLRFRRSDIDEWLGSNEYVFTFRGKAIRQDIRKSWRRVINKVGLHWVTLHTLRRTFASQLVMAGVPLRDVQDLMGHQSFQTTLRYAHLSPDHVKRQVLNLPFADKRAP